MCINLKPLDFFAGTWGQEAQFKMHLLSHFIPDLRWDSGQYFYTIYNLLVIVNLCINAFFISGHNYCLCLLGLQLFLDSIWLFDLKKNLQLHFANVYLDT